MFMHTAFRMALLQAVEKRLRRSQIFIARDAKNGTSSVGAKSSWERVSMPLLTELFAFRSSNYKDFAPTELVILSAETGGKTRFTFFNSSSGRSRRSWRSRRSRCFS